MFPIKFKLNKNIWTDLFGEDYERKNMYLVRQDVDVYFKDVHHPKVNAERILRIVVLPSFEFQLRKCYEIYAARRMLIYDNQTRTVYAYAVLRMTWNEMEEFKRLDTEGTQVANKPNIIHRLKIADEDLVLRIFGRFEQAKIPSWSLNMALDDFSGNDGTMYEVCFGDGFWRSVKYSWWEEAPEAWAELEKATHAAMNDIDRLLDEETDS